MYPEKIKKQVQLLARCEKSLALEKLKKRRADTRRKIELGGLVIKAGIDSFNKAIVLGALDYAVHLLQSDRDYTAVFQARGEQLFFKKDNL